MTFVLQTVMFQDRDWIGEQKFYYLILKRGRSVTSAMGGGQKPSTLLGLGNVGTRIFFIAGTTY